MRWNYVGCKGLRPVVGLGKDSEVEAGGATEVLLHLHRDLSNSVPYHQRRTTSVSTFEG